MNPFYLLFSFLFFASVIFADDAKLTKIPVNAGFITALTADDSGVFIGSEDNGVFRYDNEDKITHYTTKDGLGDDNAYALAIDKLGRLWVGHQSSGVSVFNGKEWKNYDVVDGPIGERIFDICPTDGDVWIATSAGITRYRIDTDTWTDITREDGLPEDQCSSLAFLKNGTLLAGTQCHGLAIFHRNEDGNYQHAKNIVAPERFGKNNESPVPLTPRGDGLPSNQINKILVTADKIWIATTAGLVQSDNTLTKLRYVRGVDYVDKVKGLYGGAPKDWEECTPKAKTQFLPEDYVTSLSVIDDKLYIGMRQKGFVVFDKTGKPLQQQYTNKNGLPDNYVSVLCSRANNLYIGTYGGGAALLPSAVGSTYRVRKNTAALPAPRKALTVKELKVLQKKLDALTEPLPRVYAAYYGEDWKTKGDWVGRTFRDWAQMYAVVSPEDHYLGFPNMNYSLTEFIGPNYKNEDAVRRWLHWLESEDRRVLWNPWFGIRRQGELDDHGEAYPLTMDGPDLWLCVRIRSPGMFRVGMYFFNKDGHEGNNRFRDYVISVYTSAKLNSSFPADYYTTRDRWRDVSAQIEKTAHSVQPLAKTRVKDFWGGVYKYFIVPGPGYYSIKIARNNSYNTIVSAVMIDRLQGKREPDEEYGIEFLGPYLPQKYEAPPVPEVFDRKEPRQAVLLWKTLDNSLDKKGCIDYYWEWRIAAYRFAAADAGNGEKEMQVYKSFQWQLNQWDAERRKDHDETMHKAWQNLYDSYDKENREALKRRALRMSEPPGVHKDDPASPAPGNERIEDIIQRMR